MLDFTMDDKLAIAMSWAESEKKKALNQVLATTGVSFVPYQH